MGVLLWLFWVVLGSAKLLYRLGEAMSVGGRASAKGCAAISIDAFFA